MKTVLSRRQDAYLMTVPVRGGFTVRFESGRATVPNDVAEVLTLVGGGFYTLPDAQADGLTAGQSVLVIRDLGMGDVLMTTPLIRHLAGAGVLVDIQTSTRFMCLFDGNPHVRTVLSLESDRPDHAAYDAVLDLRMFVENAENQQQYIHRVPGFALAADIALPEDQFHLDYFPLRGEMDAIVQKINRELKDAAQPLIAYVWGAMSDTRSWSLIQHEAVLTALLAEGYQVIVLSATPQRLPVDHADLFNATGRFSLRETASALLLAEVVVTPDTGLFHLASALNKPVVTYFGAWPISERATHSRLSVLNAPQNCARLPCRSYQCLNRDEDGQPRCLSVPPQIVVGAVKHQLQAQVSQQETPAASQQETPAASQQETPAASQQETPAASQQETPAASQQETPAASQQETPAASQQETPAASQQETPAASQQETPAASQQETPAASQQETPAASQQETPAASQQETPAINSFPAPRSTEAGLPNLSICHAAVFCTAAIDADPGRYQAWADYYTAFFAGEDVDLFLFNDGPAQHQITGNVTVVPVGTEPLGRTEAGGCFPGWKRSMGAAVARLSAEYGAVAHIESDLGITAGGKAAFLHSLRTPGFYAGWCPRHSFPETALQVINSEAARQWYIRRYADTGANWAETFDGECFEHFLQRELTPIYILSGNRHEGSPPAFDPSWDYLGQCSLREFQRLYPVEAEAIRA